MTNEAIKVGDFVTLWHHNVDGSFYEVISHDPTKTAAYEIKNVVTGHAFHDKGLYLKKVPKDYVTSHLIGQSLAAQKSLAEMIKAISILQGVA